MLIYCPSCYMLVRLPRGEDDSENVPALRCPGCERTFAGPPVATGGPPAAIPQAAGSPVAHGDAPAIVQGDAQEFRSDLATAPESPEELHATFPATLSTAAPLSLPPRVKRGATNSRSRGGIPFVAVILGGLTALPLATAICWYALGRDPLRWGPTVARYVPAIVPARFGGTLGSTRPAAVRTQAGSFDEPPASFADSQQDLSLSWDSLEEPQDDQKDISPVEREPADSSESPDRE